MVITTDLMLAGQDLENETRFFSETSAYSSGGGHQSNRAPRITMVFVEVVGSSCCTSSDDDASDPLTAWNELQRLRDGTGDGAAYALVGWFRGEMEG